MAGDDARCGPARPRTAKDFGCSKRCDISKTFTTVGSIPWMAPEVIQQQHGYGRKADIWSLGCTMIEMATAHKPWGDEMFRKNIAFALGHISMSSATPPIPDSLDPTVVELISLCVSREADERPTAAEMLQHRYLAEV